VQLKTGAIVNIAWPDTKVRKTNAPYDGPMTIVGLCKDGYYKVGHAALLLIDYRTTEVITLHMVMGGHATSNLIQNCASISKQSWLIIV